MIIQTGFRTDIPAFYSKWFSNRLQEGFVLVRNPYNQKLVTKYILSPSVVDMIGFCSKNPAPMLPYMNLLEPYGQFWFVTITPYGKEIEPHVPNKNFVLQTFKELSRRVGTERIAWRYDPIFISKDYPVERHLNAFEKMASELSGFTRTCVISFIDLYAKVLEHFPEAESVPRKVQILLAKEFVRIGKRFGIHIQSCAEGDFLKPYGVDISGCISGQVIAKAIRAPLRFPTGKRLREACNCYAGNDIGTYDSCGHLCKYCYATSSQEAFEKNIRNHDPKSPLLIGHLEKGDRIRSAEQESWKTQQTEIIFPG